MKKLCVLLLGAFLIPGLSLAQVDEEMSKQLELLTQEILKAKKEESISELIKLGFDRFYLNTQTLNHNQSYVWGIEVEELLEQNPDLPVVKKIKQPFYSRMGWLFNTFGEYPSSKEYYLKSIALAKIAGDAMAEYKDRGAVAFTEYLMGNISEAEIQLDQILKEVEELGNKELIAETNYRYYTLWIDRDPVLALKYVRNSLGTQSQKDYAHRLICVGTCFDRLDQYDSALVYARKGLTISEDNSYFTQKSNAHILLMNIYSGMEDYQQALENFEIYHSMHNNSRSFQSGMMLMAINQEILQEKLLLQESLAEEKLSNQRLLIWIFVYATLILGTVLFYLYSQIKLINKQKAQIEIEKNRAEQSEKYVEQFLTNLSHEIRTPMNAISGMVYALLRKPDSEFRKDYLEAMRISSDNLLVLLNDILDLAKIESGKIQFQPEPVNAIQVADEVIHLLNLKASEKNILLKLKVSKDFPAMIFTDSARLTQVLTNLVGNAIKFTNDGRVELRLSLEKEAVRFEVMDTGIGIPNEKLEVIFDSFEQVDGLHFRKNTGTGLGLSISKKLVELQGGKIWAESQVGEGSAFIFTLPFRVNSVSISGEKMDQDADLHALGESLRGVRILLADDDEFNLMIVQDDLNYFIPEVKILVAGDGKEALEKFASGSFELVLLDIHMPKLGGAEVASEIRKIEKEKGVTHPIPIIALTANIIPSEIEKFMKYGMSDYIPKPYRIEEILKKIAFYCLPKTKSEELPS